MRHVDERDPEVLLQRLQLDLQVLAQPGVERAERLVEQQHARVQDQRAGQRHALLLAARELRGPALVEARQLHERERVADAAAALVLTAFWQRRPNATFSATVRCGNSA